MKNLKWVLVVLFSMIICYFVFSKFKVTQGYTNQDDYEINKRIEEVISSMTLEEKIGQMIIINYDISNINDELRSILEEVKPSGFVLMHNNYSTFDDTKKFVEDIRSYSDLPFIISTDQEGGRVQRLQLLNDATAQYVPPMSELGNKNNPELAYEVGKLIAEEVRTLGINVVYAPVVDVFSNPENEVIGDRSFGSDSTLVTNMAIGLSKGLEDNGVISTYKHFPGHGDTNVDSHTSLPIVTKTYEELNNNELVPFKNAINKGAKMIMTAHIALPKVTGDNTPSTMSKEIISGILRNKLGYNGVVISDALNMKALTNNYSDEEIYTKVVDAGVDILLMPRDPRLAVQTIKNNITEERINESVRRILKFKFKYLKEDNILDKSYLGSEEHKSIIEKID